MEKFGFVSYVQDGQPLICKRAYSIAKERDADEDQEDLVGLAGKNTAIVVVEDIMHAAKNSVVPKFTASVIVMLPTTNDQPHIHEMIRR